MRKHLADNSVRYRRDVIRRRFKSQLHQLQSLKQRQVAWPFRCKWPQPNARNNNLPDRIFARNEQNPDTITLFPEIPDGERTDKKLTREAHPATAQPGDKPLDYASTTPTWMIALFDPAQGRSKR
jgi:hypothetical protein